MDNFKPSLPDILGKRVVSTHPLFDVEQVDLRFSNGQIRRFTRTHPKNPGSVLVVPMLDEKTLLLIREYGVGIEDYSLTFPKGALSQDENVLKAANRELMEEVGYGAHKLTLMKTFSSSPSYSTARMHCVLARDLYPQSLAGDEPEPLEVVPWELSHLDQLLVRGDFHEARSIAALLILERNLVLGN